MHKDKEMLHNVNKSKKSNHIKFENILKKPMFLAPILKYTVDEYKDLPISEIKKLIVTDKIDVIGKVINENGDIIIDDLKQVEGVVGTEVQIGALNTLNIKYDIKFKAIDPRCLKDKEYTKSKLLSYIHIDIELEQVYNIKKAKRGQYYSSSLITNQLDKLFIEKNYNQLEKVYSIWIFNKQIPKDETNTILRFRSTPTIERKYGEEVPITLDLWEDASLNLSNVVFVRRDNCELWKRKEQDNEYDNPLFKYLDGILNYRMDYIDEFVDFEEEPEVKKEVVEMIEREDFVGLMCKMEGRMEGRVEGRKEGRIEGRMEGQAEIKNEIAEKLLKLGKFSIDEIADITETPPSDIKKLKDKLAN